MEINIPHRLKSVRESRQLTQAKVAAAIGMKTAAYGHYEAGRAEPSLPILLKLTTFYELNSIDQLLGIEGEIGKARDHSQSKVINAYHSADIEKRKIVDFILNLNC